MKKSYILPQPLIDAIKATGLTGKNLELGLDFIDYIFYKYATCEEDLENTNFIHIPSQTIKSFFNRDYKTKFMNIFLKNNIIIRSPFLHGSEKSNHSFGYRINDQLLNFQKIDIMDINSKKPSSYKNIHPDNIEPVISDLNMIEFDFKGMIDYIRNLDINSLVILNQNISEEFIELTPIFSKVKFKSSKSLKDALILAKRLRKDLIQYDNRFFIAKNSAFCHWKEIALKCSLSYTVRKLYMKDFYASRNSTNFRLDTNLTNLKSDFFTKGFLRLDGEILTDIDLKNSQPTLLSFLFSGKILDCDSLLEVIQDYQLPDLNRSKKDVDHFIQLCESGQLYDQVGLTLGWSRKYAKQNFIKTMFSDARWSGKNKMLLKELFPSIIGWMDEFKIMNGNTLAVLLQRVESRIFIDNIYVNLRLLGYRIYTKHDSILCKSSQKPEIMKEMCRILDEYGFKYILA